MFNLTQRKTDSPHLESWRRGKITFALLSVAGLACIMPWIFNVSASLRLDARDLAEWASIHPAATASAPHLLTSLLLRLPLTLVALAVAFSTQRNENYSWWLRLIIVIIIGIMLRPPQAFLKGETNNLNYTQQFALFSIVVVGSLAGLSGAGRVPTARRLGVSCLCLVATTTVPWGFIRASALLRGMNIDTTVGLGLPLFVVAMGCAALLNLADLVNTKKKGSA